MIVKLAPVAPMGPGQSALLMSPPRTRGSIFPPLEWIPASAGMTNGPRSTVWECVYCSTGSSLIIMSSFRWLPHFYRSLACLLVPPRTFFCRLGFRSFAARRFWLAFLHPPFRGGVLSRWFTLGLRAVSCRCGGRRGSRRRRWLLGEIEAIGHAVGCGVALCDCGQTKGLFTEFQ